MSNLDVLQVPAFAFFIFSDSACFFSAFLYILLRASCSKSAIMDSNTTQKQVITAAASSAASQTPKQSSEPTRSGENQSWWKWSRETTKDNINKHLAHEFNGKLGFDHGHWFHRPEKHDSSATFDKAGELESDEKGRYVYRNYLGQKYHKHADVATYLSPTNYVPKRLVVQTSPYVRQKKLAVGDWRRRKMTGSVPKVLKLAEWTLRPSNRDENERASVLGRVQTVFRILLMGLPLQIMLALPLTSSWDDGDIDGQYTEFPGNYWKWPKHAINPLDMKPAPFPTEVKKKSPTSRTRLLRPRQLIILKDGEWVLDPNPEKGISYLFISYANMHFHTDDSEAGRKMISDMAEYSTLKAGKTAYWLDYRCRAPKPGPELDRDVYRMCDVIRGAHQVVVMLKGDELKLKQEWGSRMWTLPEGLLAAGNNIYFCTPESNSFKIVSMSKIEMSGSVWEDPEVDDEDGPTRLLAEHFTGILTLSRLEILSNAIAATGNRYDETKAWLRGDMAYALMGLLHYRIEKDADDTTFQAIARLSLANDNDRLIERMVCLYPNQHTPQKSAFMKLAQPDLYSTHLWDIEPLCQVVGVGNEDNTVILDNTRAMHIRWKNFPRMSVIRHYGMKKLLAELFVRSGAWPFIFAIQLAITYAPFFLQTEELGKEKVIFSLSMLVAGFFATGLLLSFVGPYSVRRLYGGQVQKSTPNLIGFEGVLPLRELEPLVFGNNSGRLSYAPSSTPFALDFRNEKERIGNEPTWIASNNPEDVEEMEKRLPEGHQLFTLVDTGSLTVSVFHAERPPTVALICGREGGMLRVVLCSWRFVNDCLVKEAVMRMPSEVYEAAVSKGWLKISLGDARKKPVV